MREKIKQAVEGIVERLRVIEAQRHYAAWPDSPLRPDYWQVKERTKFYALDCGGSGAFMVDKETGEIYNITGIGRPDYRKKMTRNIGNVLTVEAAYLHARRWNYVRDNQGHVPLPEGWTC